MDEIVIDDFIARYEQGDPTQGYSAAEARFAFERAVRTAPPDTLQRAARRAVDRLDDGQRAEFDELLQREALSVDQGRGTAARCRAWRSLWAGCSAPADSAGLREGARGGGAAGSAAPSVRAVG